MGRKRGRVRGLNEGQIAAAVITGTLCAVAGLSEAVLGPRGVRVFVGFVLFYAVFFTTLSSRTGFRADESGITERPVGRVRRTRWCAVSGVEIRTINAGAAQPKHAIALTLRNGGVHVLSRTFGYREPRRQQTAAELFDLLVAHRATCGTCRELPLTIDPAKVP